MGKAKPHLKSSVFSERALHLVRTLVQDFTALIAGRCKNVTEITAEIQNTVLTLYSFTIT